MIASLLACMTSRVGIKLPKPSLEATVPAPVWKVLSRGSVVCVHVWRPTIPSCHEIHIPIAIYIAQSASTISEPQADARAKGKKVGFCEQRAGRGKSSVWSRQQQNSYD